MQPIREPVRVAVVFGPGHQIRPVWFDWHNRKYTIRETTYSWRGKVGDSLTLHFSVSDGNSLYELIYNTCEQSWILAGVEM